MGVPKIHLQLKTEGNRFLNDKGKYEEGMAARVVENTLTMEHARG